MIKQIEQLIIIILILIIPLYSNPTEKDYNKFLAGIIALKNNDTIPMEQKIKKFNQLKSITGIETSDAISFLENYMGKPAEWKAVIESMKKLVDEEKF